MKNNLVVTIVIAIIVAAVAFFGGMQYGKTQVAAATGTGSVNQSGQPGGPAGQYGQGRRFGRNGMGNATVGQIVSVDQNSMTVKMADGSSKIVNLSGSTTYTKTETGTQSDLKTGERVAAVGTTNSDGSITAQNVQINPTFRGPGAGRPSGVPQNNQ